MVERQSGMLSKLRDGEVVEDVTDASLETVTKVKPTADDLAATAHIPIETKLKTAGVVDAPPLAVLGDEETGLAFEISAEDIKEVFGEAREEVIDEDVKPDLDTENWMSQLNEDEIFNSDKGPAPRLHGLRRLAKPYILSEESKVNALIVVPKEYKRTLETSNGEDDVMSKTEVVGTYNFPMASVTFNITLVDGRTFSDSADAFYSNCEALALFPTAVASARAEARCLRKVLGIREHAAEEIVDKDPGEELAPDDDSPIKPEQTKLIEKILKQIDMSLKDLLEEITTREVFSAEELTTGEARKALRLLNDHKKKKNRKKASKKS